MGYTRKLRLVELGAASSYEVEENWSFLSILPLGGDATLENDIGESIIIPEGIAYNLQMDAEVIDPVTITTTGGTAKITWYH